MYCGTCGKELRDGAKFCDECGAVQPGAFAPEAKPEPEVIQPVLIVPPKEPKPEKPPKVKRERKKIRVNFKALGAAAIVLILAAAAVLLYPILFPEELVEVYVITSYTRPDRNGGTFTAELRWDDQGNPTEFTTFRDRSLYTSWEPVEDPEQYAAYSYRELREQGILNDKNGTLWKTKEYHAPWEAEYDEHGNLLKLSIKYTKNDGYSDFGSSPYLYITEDVPYEHIYEYDYSYDEKGRIESCKYYYNDELQHKAVFTWDKRGNLTQVGSSENEPWYSWEYDSKGRLTAECIWYTGMVTYREFVYDGEGNVASYTQRVWDDLDPEDVQDMQISDLDMDDAVSMFTYSYTYDQEGKLLSYEMKNKKGEVQESKTFTYDDHGNPVFDDCTYDEHGNIITCGYCTYEYKKVEMTPEAAQRYYQWEGIITGGISFGVWNYYRMYTYYWAYRFDPDSSYYLSLIPYPQPKRPE